MAICLQRGKPFAFMNILVALTRFFKPAMTLLATCRVCGQTQKTEMDGSGRCKACRSLEEARRRGVPAAKAPEQPDVIEARLIALLAPLRRAWVREFLATAYRRRSPKTRQMCFRALAHFDRYLSEQMSVGGGQWSLVTLDEVHGFLAENGRFALQPAKAYFSWLRSRKKVERPIARALPKRSKPLRIKLLHAVEWLRFIAGGQPRTPIRVGRSWASSRSSTACAAARFARCGYRT